MSNPWSESFEDMRSSVEKLHEANQQRFKFRVKDKNKGTYTVKTTRQRADILRRTPSVLSVERIEMSENVEESNDGNLANNYPPYDKVTRGDVIAGATGKDQMGGKKKKSVRKEGYSDWRSEMPENFFFESLTEKVSPASPYCDVMPDQKSGENQKDPQRGTQNQKLLKMRKEDLDLLAEELGGEVVDIREYAAAVRALPAISRIVKTGGLKGFRVPVKPPHLPRVPQLPAPEPGKPTKPEKPGKPTKPEKPGKPTKPKKPGKPTKPETKPKVPTKPKDKGSVIVPGTEKGGKVEPKTQPIPSPKQTPQTQKTPPIVATPGMPKSGPNRGFTLRLPIPGLPKGPNQSITTAWAKQISSKR